MKTLKKISPIEFRLHTKKFVSDQSPLNYFEKLRFTILFSRLLFWFFRRYGLYLFSYKLRILEECFLFQFYYYRTRQNKKYVKTIWWRKLSRTVFPLIARRRKKRARRKYKKLWKFLTRRLFRRKLLIGRRMRFSLKSTVSTVVRRNLRRIYAAKFYRLNEQVIYIFPWQRRRFIKHKKRRIYKWFKKQKKGVLKYITFNFFFAYFFLFFFKLRAHILSKSLYRYLISNRLYRAEHRFVLKRLGYLKQYNWAFDFLFLFHTAINFANFDFIIPFFVYQVKRSYKQRPFLNVLFNLLRFIYYFKTNIYGIKVLVHGPYDRHGRSRTLLFRIGTVSLTSYRSFILYDTIQWPTFYGAIQIKLWILYSVQHYSK